jgi:hypothetical protein
MNPNHDHNAYLAKIKKRADSKARRAYFVKGLARKAGKLVGITPNTDKAAPKKEAKTHPYVVQKRSGAAKNFDISAPRPTPANDYINKKRQSTKSYNLENQKKKIRAPYPTR